MAGEIDCAMRLLEDHYPGIMDQNEDMLLQLRCRKFVEMVTSSSSHLKALDKQEKLGGSHHDMEMAETNGHTQRKTATQLESTPEPMDVDQANNLNKSPTARKKAKMVDKSATPTTKGASSDEGLEGLGRLKDAIKYGQYLQEQYRDSQRSSIQDMLIDSFSVLAYSDPEPGVSLTAAVPVSKPVSRKAVADTVNTAILGKWKLSLCNMEGFTHRCSTKTYSPFFFNFFFISLISVPKLANDCSIGGCLSPNKGAPLGIDAARCW